MFKIELLTIEPPVKFESKNPFYTYATDITVIICRKPYFVST